jgi:hypothetical protein
MIGHCKFCGEKLSNDARVDLQFCSNEHRIKFHNQKRQVKNLLKKAMKAIEELEQIGQSDSVVARDANDAWRKLYLRFAKVENDKLR